MAHGTKTADKPSALKHLLGILLFLQPIIAVYKPAQGPLFNTDRSLVESVYHDFQVPGAVYNDETQMKESRRPLQGSLFEEGRRFKTSAQTPNT